MRYGLHTAAGFAAAAAMTAFAAPAVAQGAPQGIEATETLTVGVELSQAQTITVTAQENAISFTGIDFALVSPDSGQLFRLGYINATADVDTGSSSADDSSCTLTGSLEADTVSGAGTIDADFGGAGGGNDFALINVVGSPSAPVQVTFGAGVDTGTNSVALTDGTTSIDFKVSEGGFAVADIGGVNTVSGGFAAIADDLGFVLNSDGEMAICLTGYVEFDDQIATQDGADFQGNFEVIVGYE